MSPRSHSIWVLSGFVLLCFAAAAVGGALTSTSVGSWYVELDKPSWTPPGWLFGPVWSALYAAMAVAAWLVWRSGRPGRGALALFGLQLALNVAWSALFFGLRNPGAAAVEIVVLWLAIAATAIAFWRCSRLASALLWPYLAWVGFASALNLAIWRMSS